MTNKRRVSIPEILSTVGLENCQQRANGPNWELWSGEIMGFRMKAKEQFLFLTGDYGWGEIEELGLRLRGDGLTDIPIIMRSGSKRARSSQTRLRTALQTTSPILTVGAFLFDGIQRALGASDTNPSAEEFGLQYFVDPSARFPWKAGVAPAVSELRRWLQADSLDNDSNIAVLLAPAGVGKTTLSEEVIRQTIQGPSKASIIPLLLKREQWANLAARGSLGILDIWMAGISDSYPRAILGTDQLERCLATGVVRPILDGFDELCSFFPSDFSATDIIEELVDLVDEGKLLITSRTQFWEENVDVATRQKVHEISLEPFNNEQRDQYLLNRFPKDTEKRRAATQVLSRIGNKAQDRSAPQRADGGIRSFERLQSLATRELRVDSIPFVVMLAAETADRNDLSTLERYGSYFSSDPLEGLILAFCNREQNRHRLPLSAEEQLRMLQILATEFDSPYSVEDVDLAIGFVSADAGSDAARLISNHALLVLDDKSLRFRYDFVSDYLAARVVRDWVADGSTNTQVVRALTRCADGGGALVDRCLDLLTTNGPPNLIELARTRWAHRPDETVVQAGLTRLFVELSKRLTPTSRKEHTETILSIFGTDTLYSVRDLRLGGSLSSLDLAGVHFDRCHFTDLELSNCRFDESTRFTQCSFLGRLSITGCENFAAADIADTCTLSVLARSVIQHEQGARKRFPITEEQIVAAVRQTLASFQIGAAGFRTRLVDNVERRLRGVTFRDRMLRSLEALGVIDRYNMSGGEAYKVSATADVRVFLQNSTRVGKVAVAIDDLITRVAG
jgi:hypothetical protein